MIDAGNVRRARLDTGGDQHLVEALGRQAVRIDALPEADVHAQHRKPATVIAQGLVELFLAGNAAGQVELAADVVGGFKQGDLVPALGRDGGVAEAGGAGAHHRDPLGGARGVVFQLSLVAGARIDQAADQLAGEGVVEAGLVAGDAGVDLVLAALTRLGHQVRVGQHRPRHRDEVGVAARQHFFGDGGHVDAVGGDHRHVQDLAQPAGDLREGGARDHGGDGRHLGLVPAEVGGDDVHPLGFQRLGQHDHLFPGQAILKHVHRRDAEDQDEVGAHSGAHPSDDLDRELHAVLEGAAPAVGALVGLVHTEGRDQVAGRADDLDTVITGLLG